MMLNCMKPVISFSASFAAYNPVIFASPDIAIHLSLGRDVAGQMRFEVREAA